MVGGCTLDWEAYKDGRPWPGLSGFCMHVVPGQATTTPLGLLERWPASTNWGGHVRNLGQVHRACMDKAGWHSRGSFSPLMSAGRVWGYDVSVWRVYRRGSSQTGAAYGSARVVRAPELQLVSRGKAHSRRVDWKGCGFRDEGMKARRHGEWCWWTAATGLVWNNPLC